MRLDKRDEPQQEPREPQSPRPLDDLRPPLIPIPNYSLSTTCPACNTPTYRHACKVRCPRCGFVWDCSEL